MDDEESFGQSFNEEEIRLQNNVKNSSKNILGFPFKYYLLCIASLLILIIFILLIILLIPSNSTPEFSKNKIAEITCEYEIDIIDSNTLLLGNHCMHFVKKQGFSL